MLIRGGIAARPSPVRSAGLDGRELNHILTRSLTHAHPELPRVRMCAVADARRARTEYFVRESETPSFSARPIDIIIR